MAHEVQRDIIANVTGPGWNYGLARVLIDTEGNAAVFVPPGQVPVQTFTVNAGSNDSMGSGQTADGGQVSYRRKGASCSFSLAKCNAKTHTLAARWDAVSESA